MYILELHGLFETTYQMCRYSECHHGGYVKYELTEMGLWLPRPGEETQAARRAARGRQPRQEEATSAEVGELEAAGTSQRR